MAGKSKMKHHLNREFGIMDHIFIGGGLEGHVYVRAIPNESGSTTTWTFVKPDGTTDQQFEQQLVNFDTEIDRWKEALEKTE